MATPNRTADQNVKDGDSVSPLRTLTRAPIQAIDHRETINPFTHGEQAKPAPTSSPLSDRHALSDEWDAAKTLPSQFQKAKGSTFATPSTRGEHTDKNAERDAPFHEVHAKKHSDKKERRLANSSSSKDSSPKEESKVSLIGQLLLKSNSGSSKDSSPKGKEARKHTESQLRRTETENN